MSIRHHRWKLLGMLQYSTSASRIAVIGGGASGIFSSIQAAASVAEVFVFEASPKTLGKVKISGGGRCNVLHDTSKATNEILENYPRGKKELRGLYSKHWTPQDSREWFEQKGVKLKTESDGRMFPTTDKSQTIIDTLLHSAEQAGVDIRKKSKVFDITKDGIGFTVSLNDSAEQFDSIILATGSSKAGHILAENLGHTIVDPVPSLFTLNTKPQVQEGGLLHELSGVSVPWARVSFKFTAEGKKKKQVMTQEGPLLITHRGISGPSTLRLSAFGAREFHNIDYKGDLFVHWAPELGNTEDLASQLWQYTSTIPKRAISSTCPLKLSDGSSAIPKRLWASMVTKCGFEKETKWCEAPKKKINALAIMITQCTLDITGKNTNKDEFVTAGGVPLKEVNLKTMESKVCPGLFLCGEVLDIDGVTGGFNFMGCWSTGYTAGTGATAYVKSLNTASK
eukprot:CAMPEP_0194227908 /NCGR_PEP_ID=MMETSP0156-20130528/43098_1 /TAXON_ID=33649 /ORGANISM="Thalassionema nitzschioides, Strain L26-B" /LENGTH=452 /DNA_ID=CAMNT_0038960405 /DNA_START=152 /DNA_END=1510 /DNA_ORIENTATION=-